MTSMPGAPAPKTPLSVSAALSTRRPEVRHSETSPLLGSVAASKHIPGWGTLVSQLEREGGLEEAASDYGHTPDKTNLKMNKALSGISRTDSPFGDMESGRGSPMGESFGE
jgi:hypothetical protein